MTITVPTRVIGADGGFVPQAQPLHTTNTGISICRGLGRLDDRRMRAVRYLVCGRDGERLIAGVVGHGGFTPDGN
jgi:hypothetical protein